MSLQMIDKKKVFKSRKVTKGFKGVLFWGHSRYGKVGDPAYEEGKTYTVSSKRKLVLCSDSGIHFCQKAEDVWGYYSPDRGKYIEVTSDTKCVQADPSMDSKTVTKRLTLGERFMGGLEFARRFFRKLKAAYSLLTADGEDLLVYTGRGIAENETCNMVGCEIQQCLSGRVVVSFARDSYAHGKLVALCRSGHSVASSDKLAVSFFDGLAYAAKPGAFAITTWGAAGVLGSALVFLYDDARGKAIVKSFNVDGKEVLPNTVYHYSHFSRELVADGEIPVQPEDSRNLYKHR